MYPTTLIIGGCRSGKSRYALQLAKSSGKQPKLFIATCVPQDDEMHERVRRHQEERGNEWQALEVPIELPTVISRNGADNGLILVDCLTLWISNIVLAQEEDDAIHRRIDELCEVLVTPPCPVVLVSNEVGAGIVPENALARRYRDLVGRTNQRVAAACGQVIWMVAGIPVPIRQT